MKKVILAASALLALSAVSAQAAEPFNSWYGGVEAGYQRDEVRFDVTTGGPLTERWDAAQYGVFLGRNISSGQLFFGGEVHFMLHSGSEDITIGTVTTELEADHTFGTSARAGFLFTPQMAAYGKIGWERGRFTERTGGVTAHDSGDGLLFGGGLEFAVNDNISLRGEYTHTNFKDGPLGGFARDAFTGGLAFRF